MLMMPPRPPGQVGVMRAESEQPKMLRPVAEEVVGATPELHWTSIEKASAYQITVSSDDGEFTWSEHTAETKIKVPNDSPLPVGQRFWVMVEPIPAHLASAGGMRSIFRTGNMPEIARYRLYKAPWAVKCLSLFGLVLLIGGWVTKAKREQFNTN